MHLVADTISSSPADPERDDLAYVFIRAVDGYALSLARPTGSPEIEVLVRDQQNCWTHEVAAALSQHRLKVCLPPAVAQALDGHTSYDIEFTAPVSELDGALRAIFVVVKRFRTP